MGSGENDGENETGLAWASVGELIALPANRLIHELRYFPAAITLQPPDSAKILDKVCAYAATSLSPNASDAEIYLQQDLKYAYNALRDRGVLRGFGSCSDALLPLKKDGFTQEDREKATGLPAGAFKPTKEFGVPEFALGSAFALLLLQALGLETGRLAVGIFGSVAIDNLAFRGYFQGVVDRSVRPAVRDAMYKHEAGHLLVAYLLGNPAQSCLLEGKKGATVWYDPEFANALKFGQPPNACLDRHSTIMMAGIAAEAMDYGKARGGADDEEALGQLLRSLDGERSWDDARIENEARWGAAQAFALLRDHKSAHEALYWALREGRGIGEAVMAIERALARLPELPAEARRRAAVSGQ